MSDEICIRVEPSDIVLTCRANETLIRCAWRNGYYWPTICGGSANCGACQCELLEGGRFAEPMTAAEETFFATNPERLQSSTLVRLACCMTVTGPMTVFKKGVGPK
jgi:2Fe-2S ferredoxin